MTRIRQTLGYYIEYVKMLNMDVTKALDATQFETFTKTTLGYLHYRLKRAKKTLAASTLQHEKWDLIALIKFSATPELTTIQYKSLVSNLSRVATNMIRDHKLQTKKGKVLLIGQKEIRLLLDNNFDEGKEHVFHLRLQDNVLLLCYFYTMARPGSLLATRPYPEKGVRWRDIELTRRVDMGKVDIDLVFTIDNFKGHQLDTALEVEYDIRGTTDERNLLFDLPVLILALGCHRGVSLYLPHTSMFAQSLASTRSLNTVWMTSSLATISITSPSRKNTSIRRYFYREYLAQVKQTRRRCNTTPPEYNS